MNHRQSPPLLAVALVVAGPALAAEGGLPGHPSLFEPPTRLQADGKVIDTGTAWGHSSPAVADLNDDGLADLVVGDFSGKFRSYLNVGTKTAPAYKSGELIQAGGVDAGVHIYCCMGSQARFHDLDGDGLRDLIANSYDPGHVYLFRGRPGNAFAAREELLDKSGVPIRSSPVQKQDHQSFGSFYEAVDFDGDGDLDLLIGCFSGELKLRINEGTAKNPQFAVDNIAVEAAGAPLKVKGHLCPVVADWDGDGLWDIVAGSADGSVTWFRNVGHKTSPAFAAGQTLVKPHDGNGYNQLLWNEADVVPGIRSQVEVTDYNGDGKLDLLLGDFYTTYNFKRDLSDEQKRQVEQLVAESESGGEEVGARMKALQDDFAKRYPGDEIYSDKATKEWSAAYRALRESPEVKQQDERAKQFLQKLRPFVASGRDAADEDFDPAKSHGHVWLFLRK